MVQNIFLKIFKLAKGEKHASVTDTEVSVLLTESILGKSLGKSDTANKKTSEEVLFGAGDQTWTDTVVTPQDFKSCASADSATPAYKELS